MKSISALSLAAVALAAPAPAPQATPAPEATGCPSPQPPSTNPTRFMGLAIHSGSDIQYLSVNANDRAFWLNKNTTTYCPEVVGCAADPNPITTFAFVEGGTLALDVTVPGGQQVYVTEEGQLKFTQAHSSSMEIGSITTGFSVEEGGLLFEGRDWWACPLGWQWGNAYGIWAPSRVKGSEAGAGCTSFKFRAQEAGETQRVWQYV